MKMRCEDSHVDVVDMMDARGRSVSLCICFLTLSLSEHPHAQKYFDRCL